jgi:putative endonuclease
MVIVYVLESLNNGIHYVGMTKNIQQRIKEHNSGRSKFTSGYKPWKIIYTEQAENFEKARVREKYLKTAAGKKFIVKHTSLSSF